MAFLVGGMAGGSEVSRSLSRKVFHAGIFTGAVPAQLLQGFWGVVVYGSVISLIVLFALWQGPGLPFYDALARPGDGDASRRYVLTPLVSTALGGLLAALLVGSFAVVGYLVCGWGDAVGEPVGKRWGRHRYSSPLTSECRRTRSFEGSLAVFLAGSLGAGVALGLLDFSFPQALGIGFVCGTAGAVVEALSGPGTDNLWVQLLPALLAWRFLG
jgi:phytol kinase